MQDVLSDLLDAISAERPVAYCRLVETRGSTPQKAGATMLVFADGSQSGTLGGGCVEADVKRRALDCLNRGATEIATFTLDDDYGWDDGLICGGRMRILIVPLQDAATRDYFRKFDNLVELAEGFTEVVVFDGEPCGLPQASVYLFDGTGREVAHLVDSAEPHYETPSVVLEHLEPLVGRPRPKAVSGIAYLPMLERCRLLIVGGGHIGRAVASLAADVDFDVWVVDDREDVVSPKRFPKAQRRISGQLGEVLKELSIDGNTYCLIVTRGHNHDEEALYHLAERGARYVGMIGSRRKIKLIFDDLIQEGISPEALSRVYAPLGINIGSQTVMEIAVSILAELIAHRNLGGVVPGRPAAVPVAEAM